MASFALGLGLKTTVWVWLKAGGAGGSEQAGVVESSSPALWARGSENGGGCPQMALGTLGQWRRAHCSEQYVFLCEKELSETLPPIDGYLTGLLLMSGMYTQTQINPLLSVPDIGQLAVEMQLFPGLWFSHAGQLVTVELVVRPSPLFSLARVQILRPYCDPNHHLVPPGCSSLLNPFSCCSALPLCNTTGGCSTGQYWCHLLEACVPTTSPCSPYDPAAEFRSFALPPRYLENPPYYHTVADLPLRINPSSELETIRLLVSDQGIMVYPDDIVAIQHTRDSGTFLHCLNKEASVNSPWRQSYLSLRGAEWEGWWKGNFISLSQGGQWKDEVVCDLRMLYLDHPHRETEHEDVFGFKDQTTVSDVRALTTGPSLNMGTKFRLQVIFPLTDKKNQIHVQINSPTLIVVKVLSGETARSSWSAPVLQSGVPFSPSCPEEVIQSWPGDKTQFSEAWFSSVTLVSSSVGVQTMNISVTDAVSSESVSVKVCSYEAITGLSIEPHGHWRMLVDMSQSFTAKFESGSSVKITWVIDNLEKFAYEGETYSVLFKKPAEYKLKVTASNPVSSLNQLIVLTVDESIPPAAPEFLFVNKVVAVNTTHLYTVRVKVDISLPVTFRWDFGDGSTSVIHSYSAPCQTMVGLMDRRVKQVYVQDSVNYTYSIPDDYTLYIKVVSQNENTDASVKMSVRPHISHVHISSSPLVPLVKQTLILEASTEPSTYSVLYTWDFGDASKVVQGIDHRVSHAFGYAGVYNVTVCANNTLTALTTSLMVEVMEKIYGLSISHNGPSEVNSATDFRAKVATEALTGIRFKAEAQHETPMNYTWMFHMAGLEPTRLMGQDVVFVPAGSGLLSVSVVATNGACSLNGGSNPRYLWDFRDSTEVLVTESRTVNHTYYIPGTYSVMVNAVNSVSHVSTELRIKVEELQCSSPQVTLIQSQSTIFRKTNVTVVHCPLVAVIKGGSHRLWSSLSDLILDGSESQDPDLDPGVEDVLQYRWTFVTVNSTETHFLKQPIGSGSNTMTVLSTQLQAGSVYTNPLSLAGHCGECGDQTLQYKWRAESQTGTILDLDEITPSTGSHSPNLVVHSGALHPGLSYTFTLSVSQPGRGHSGIASITVLPTNPLQGGLCDLSPESDIYLLETLVTYSCSGWRENESEPFQLIYTLQVEPCQTISTVCPVLILYRGTRSTFSSFVPMGSQSKGKGISVITVTVLVEDHLGTKVTALNRTLAVINPARDEVASHWLLSKSRKELWGLFQHGNLHEIIPYSIALTSQLNQMEPRQSASKLIDRREIRENVTRVLASLPTSSLLDVDQISSALAQSTAFPSELVSENCQKLILKAVGKMINVMEGQKISGVFSATDTGRNILNIIGNILAALSEAVRPSSSHPSYSSPLQPLSQATLSALRHASALTRSLTHSRVHEEAPLLLSTPYISTAGYRGDPSDLLCSHKSNWFKQHQTSSQTPSTDRSESSLSCQFHIPESFIAHLKSQTSEVVQVLFGVDGALASSRLLAAAKPPISTSLVSMELSTPEGEPIPIQNLDPEQAMTITLPNKYPVEQDHGGGNVSVGEAGNGTCLTVTLPIEGQSNFIIKALDNLDENAGIYLSFNFSLAPGAPAVRLGHVKIELSSTVPGLNASQDSQVIQWPLSLSGLTASIEKTIFLSPLLNRTDKPLAVNLTSSLADGGPVHVSLCVFSSLCQYYSLDEGRWSRDGLQPLGGSTLHTAQCLTRHLTMFGASLFVHPRAIVLLPPSGGPIRNLLVGIVCAALVLIHLLVGLIAHKLDHLESLRVSQIPLCGRSGLYHYRVLVKTGWRRGAGTTAHVGISLYGVNKSGSRHLQRDGAFQRGSLDQFHLETDDNLGEVWKIRIWHDNTGLDPSWYVQHVVVWDPQTDHLFFFLLDDWLSVENQRNGTVEKEVLASCPEELSQFQRVLSSQLIFGMMERHLWVSLWERPAHSRFTRAQRVTCSALMLHLYLALGALWYGAVGSEGHSGPVSAHLLVNVETVAVGVSLALLVFPLQCFLCFLFRKAHKPVPPSPLCHSVEMDVYLGQSELSGPSFLSLSNSSTIRDSSSSLLESKMFDSSTLDFWAASGLAPQVDRVCQGTGVGTWPSCDSLLDLPVGSCLTKITPAHDLRKASPVLGPTQPLRRKKALKQLCLASPSSLDTTPSPVPSPHIFHHTKETLCSNYSPIPPSQEVPSTMNGNHAQVHNNNLKTFLTLSEEDLMMSIAAATEDTADLTKSNSDSGRDSPRTTSSLSTNWTTSYSSWSDRSEDKSLHGADVHKPDPLSCPSMYGSRFYKCPSVVSIDSVASTFLPSPSPASTRSSSTTRIGVARGPPNWLLPTWALYLIYPLVAVMLGGCLAVVGLYGSFFSRTVVLMWLVSVLFGFLTSALLLEPLKVFVQALIYTTLWRPVDPEVEEQLARETTVVRAFEENCSKVRPPCGYGLLQAKEEARKIQALRSLMRHCVCQLLFLLLVLMVNYQDSVEQRQARLLHSTVRHCLHKTLLGAPNLTSLRDWSDAEQWINHTLVPHLHQHPSLHLVGLPLLQYTHPLGPVAGLDLQVALKVVLLISGLLVLFGELWSMATERAQYLSQCRHWFQLLLVLLSLGTAVLHFSFLSLASSCVSKLRSQPDNFINFHSASLLAQRSSQCSAVLLTVLVLKLLGTLRFVRRWLVIWRVLLGAWRELWALAVLLLLLLLLCTHLGNMLFSRSVEGFLSARQAGASVLSILRGRMALQRLCRIHPVLGPLYGVLLMAERAELYHPTIEPQDYEMVEFFIKRLKLWMGLTKTKEFRHRVTFEGMDIPPSRSSQESRLSTLSSGHPSSRSPSFSASFSSPRPLSSALSVRSEDSSVSEPGFDVQPYLDHLVPCVSALLSCFDRVNQITEDVHNLEMKLEEAQTRRRKIWISNKAKGVEIFRESTKPKDLDKEGRIKGEARLPKTLVVHPSSRVSLKSSFSFNVSTLDSSAAPNIILSTQSSHSHSASPQVSTKNHYSEAINTAPGISGLCPAVSPETKWFQSRRAWHSGSSHSADAAQRAFLFPGGAFRCGNREGNLALMNARPRSEEGVRRCISDGVPVKRKAWISEEPDTEQD
ncbi:hypothetical protein Q5P01_023899 [Channa striata]|uniref:Polycystin-1 n=1 Tax=Channa striata TaxID=64152 RepID=A0AA88LP34_CHASR|nr:hypothetical protein Q5P01_023899 [Channa striata]